MYCPPPRCLIFWARLLGGCWIYDFDEQKQNMVASFSRFSFLICPHLPSHFLHQRKAASCLVSSVVDLKVLDKTGRGKLQLGLEPFSFEKEKACGIQNDIAYGAWVTQHYLCHLRNTWGLQNQSWSWKGRRSNKWPRGLKMCRDRPPRFPNKRGVLENRRKTLEL